MSNYLDQITVGSTTYDLQDSNAQRKTVQGSGAPTTSTVGAVGSHYFNTAATSAPYEYICTNVTGNVYTWLPAGYGEDGESGIYYGSTQPTDPDIKVWIDSTGTMDGAAVPSGGAARDVLMKSSASNYAMEWRAPVGVFNISLPSSNWSAHSSLSDVYTQTVTVSNGTTHTKVDLDPDAATIVQMINDGVSNIHIENNNGTFKAFAIGAAPTAALTIQASRIETVSE